MARSSKREKRLPVQNVPPLGKIIKEGGDPERYYEEQPSWNFASADKECWGIYEDEVKSAFWSDVLPRLQALESQTWLEILLGSKKHNHSIDVNTLNPRASARIDELQLELEAIISLKVNGTYRIYGYMERARFHVLWIDLHHGDNKNCVCRSNLKHT